MAFARYDRLATTNEAIPTTPRTDRRGMATPPPLAVVSTTASPGSFVPPSGSVRGATFAEDSVGASVGAWGAGVGTPVGMAVIGIAVGAAVMVLAVFGTTVGGSVTGGGSEAPLAED